MTREETQAYLQPIKTAIIGHDYRHFKGAVYHVDEIGVHSETGEALVIYHNVLMPEKTWIFYESVTNTYVVFVDNKMCYIVDNPSEIFLKDLNERMLKSLSKAKKLY